MGIEKKNKKNSPTPAGSPSATSTSSRSTSTIYWEVLLLKVEVALGEPAGVAGRREDQPSKC
jgi:hypothetical protein